MLYIAIVRYALSITVYLVVVAAFMVWLVLIGLGIVGRKLWDWRHRAEVA